MGCKHEHLRTVGDRLYCKDCKAELPIEFLTAAYEDVAEEPKGDQPEVQEAPAVNKKKAPAKKAPAKKKGE